MHGHLIPIDLSRCRDRAGRRALLTQRSRPVVRSIDVDAAVIDPDSVLTQFVAETLLPTKHGLFRLRGYRHSLDKGVTFTEPTAIVSGAVEGRENVPVRVHDACYTSEVLGSLKCDCAEQLALAMKMIHDSPPGMIIYLQQEGRGIGLANKIAAYSLQEQGLDTVEANRALGLPDDCREYTCVINILKDLGIKSIKLITNNPRKINELSSLGLKITGRIPCIVEAGEYNQGYLDTKREKMDHIGVGELSGGDAATAAAASSTTSVAVAPFCYWLHEGEGRSPRSSMSSLSSMDGDGGGGGDLARSLLQGFNTTNMEGGVNAEREGKRAVNK